MMRVQVAIPDHRIDRPVLDAALEAVTRLDESLIRNGEAPTFDEAVHRVRWRPEPPGQEHFDNAQTVMQRGHGDCDDLAPWHAASLRVTGQDPGARATVYKSGPSRWHAVVERTTGPNPIDDPSRKAGMGRPGGALAAASRPLGCAGVVGSVGAYMVRPQIALTPAYGQWRGRVDVPWNWAEDFDMNQPEEVDWGMTSLHTAPLASTALVGSILGAIDLAEKNGCCDPTHIDRLLALAAAADGNDYYDIADEYGDHDALAAVAVVGAVYGTIREQYGLHPYIGDFGDFLEDALPIAQDVLPAAAAAIPGYGPIIAPAVKYGLDLAERELKEGRAPKKGPMPDPRNPSPRQARPRAPQPHARPRTASHREADRWLCIPARWQ